ncbi:MAG: DNA helicase UvrD [Chloroflexi bacterium]|nr:DNA helicase UvrD [Chloroflexota bacterium]
MDRRLVVDLHTHSRFAIGCSSALTLESLSRGAWAKGIDVLATGDFTHPAWLAELKSGLKPVEEGVFESALGCQFVLGAEVASIWSAGGRGRRVHSLLLAPGFPAVDRFNARLAKYTRLESDGRPMTKLSAGELARMAWDVDERFVVMPAHVWTPWYGMYGSKSGFDSIEECFGEASSGIRAIETGLSSDPAMNWRFSDLDGRVILSFSDAHSPANLGREVTMLDADASYESIRTAIECGGVLETVEFFPEHGKYHLDGHSKCGVRLLPAESAATDGRCAQCGRLITLGVVNRVEQLADKPEYVSRASDGLIRGPEGRPPFRRIVPLEELIAWGLGTRRVTKGVQKVYSTLLGEFGNELSILIGVPEADLEAVGAGVGYDIARAIIAVRKGRVQIDPGYDGAYGTVTPILD